MKLPLFTAPAVPNQFIKTFDKGISLVLKREDLLHPEISGNKFRKLKYNLEEALRQKKSSLLTFGGAYSNHITATAAAGKEIGMKTVGIIRGEELGLHLEKTLQENPSLRFAHNCGMQLEFMSREEYRNKTSEEVLQRLQAAHGDFFLLPEGGTSDLAIKGCEEIIEVADKGFDYICCAVGTGGTISGISNSAAEAQKVLGFPALKGEFLLEEIKAFTKKNNWELILDYHFGGYAKVNAPLIHFMNSFKKDTGIQLDPIYTGKMMFGIYDLIANGYFSENTRILAVHTGGLQGIAGMNHYLRRKNLPLII